MKSTEGGTLYRFADSRAKSANRHNVPFFLLSPAMRQRPPLADERAYLTLQVVLPPIHLPLKTERRASQPRHFAKFPLGNYVILGSPRRPNVHS
jgi:hypothetical protein